MTGLSDSFQRPIDYLRISVTDRCNLRCVYCMPKGGIELAPHPEILTYEEIMRVATAAANLGVSRVRLTGGEPLVRVGLPELVRQLRAVPGITDISLTTNAVLLARDAVALKDAGLNRVNISLDTLKPERFTRITRGTAQIEDTLAGIVAAQSAGLEPVKINMVTLAGVNDDEIIDFARKTIDSGWHVRFIEHMPFYGSADHAQGFISARQVKDRLWELGKMEPFHHQHAGGPARYYRFPGASGSVGFTAVSEHFCFQCNRLRLTADGKLRACLMSEDEVDLRDPLRAGASDDDIKALLSGAAAAKPLQHKLQQDGEETLRRPFSQVGG